MGRLGRRDFFKTSSAILGAALLQPTVFRFAVSEGGDKVGFQAAEESDRRIIIPKATPFPRSLRARKLSRPNILLIVMDTVRADHLACYGYSRETTPCLDAFAADAKLYQNVLAPGHFTLPCHASMFTGLSVRAHGADMPYHAMDGSFQTLAEQLQSNGYQTAAFSSNAIFITPANGFGVGFDTFWNPGNIKDGDAATLGDRTSAATDIHGRLAEWLSDGYDPAKPFFLFLNYIEAHQPYLPPPESLRFATGTIWKRWRNQCQGERTTDHTLTEKDILSSDEIAELEALYDDEIRYLDRKIGQLLDYLKDTGFDENTVVMITSDHGEHFNEHHQMEHQYSLYEPLVRVPLIVRHGDHFAPGREASLVQSHDVYPTALQLAGLDWQPSPGQTCRSLLQPTSEPRYGISEFSAPDMSPINRVVKMYPGTDCSRFQQRFCAVQKDSMKLIYSDRSPLELYDLFADPLETVNIADQKPDVTKDLMAAMTVWEDSFDRHVVNSSRRQPSEETLRAMRGLGYVQ